MCRLHIKRVILLIVFSGFIGATINASESPCPDGMAFIPAGPFLMGWDNGEPDERPERVVYTHAYCVDEYEYPNNPDEPPMLDVSFNRAKEICEEQGKRMCAEAEWERACRGPRGTIYTATQEHGDVKKQCNVDTEGAKPGGEMPACVNGYGVHNMTGNAWEWADGKYDADTDWPLVKGGSYQRGVLFASCYARFTQPPEDGGEGQGFRCCKDAAVEPSPRPKETCSELKTRATMLREAMRLRRDPDTRAVIYVDPKNVDTAASAVVLKSNSAETITFTTEAGGVIQESKVISQDQALGVIQKIQQQLGYDLKANDFACSVCGGGCVCVFDQAGTIITSETDKNSMSSYGINSCYSPNSNLSLETP